MVLSYLKTVHFGYVYFVTRQLYINESEKNYFETI